LGIGTPQKFQLLNPSLPRSRPTDTRTEHTRQRLTPHVKQHRNPTGNQRRHSHTKARKQHKWDTDILLLTRRTTPRNGLLPRPVLLLADDRGRAGAAKAFVTNPATAAVATAGVGVVRAFGLGLEAFGQVVGEGMCCVGGAVGGEDGRGAVAFGAEGERCLFLSTSVDVYVGGFGCRRHERAWEEQDRGLDALGGEEMAEDALQGRDGSGD
jgi:hypothetical protein